MNYHCWHNSRPRIDDDDEKTWPKLPDGSVQERHNMRSILRPQISSIDNDLAGSSQGNNFQENLNALEFPKLGENVLKRKHSFVDSDRSEVCENFADSGRRRVRRNRSTDLIRINLQKALRLKKYSLRLETEQPTKITVDICKLNVNMNVASPQDAKWLISKPKRSTMYIEKKKKLSRLKHLILYERMARKQNNESTRQIGTSQDTQGDIPGINFDKFTIDIGPQDDPELVKKMSALSCLNTNYRESSEINITEDTVTYRPDLHEKMSTLSLQTANGLPSNKVYTNNDDEDSCDFTAIDCQRLDAALDLKVCDETGEFTDNVVIKQEPGTIKFSNKFREYCTNTVTPELKKYLEELLGEISRLQKKMYERDSVKGKSKRRYYAGIKEVQKHVELKKIKFVVIAPDVEKIKIEGGLDDSLDRLIGNCKRYQVPYCFGLCRRKLGYYVHGKGIVSCVGIANFSGAEEKLKNVLLEVVETRNEFSRLVGDEAKTVDVYKLLPQEELILSEIINAYLKILSTNS